MAKPAQWVLNRIVTDKVTKVKKAFVIGNPSGSLLICQLGFKAAKAAYPDQQIVLRDLEAFNQTPHT